MARPRLSEEEKEARKKAKEADVEIRDNIRIYFSPLQFARLRDFHSQGGPLPGEQIRIAVDNYHRELIASREYVPSECATPDGARAAWMERLEKRKSGAKNRSEEMTLGEDQ